MAKAESGLRQRIKMALEADGWSVVTQHGSAYSPNIPDLLVVLAALEVKTEDGDLRPGQRNRIRRFLKQGIPPGVVRSVAEARQGMALVKQGAYPVPDPDIDMSFLNNLLNDGSVATAEPASADAEELDNLMGMEGKFETFEAVPATEEPESQPAPAGTTTTYQGEVLGNRPLVDAYQSVLKVGEPHPDEIRADLESTLQRHIVPEQTPPQQYQAVPATGLGVLEQIVGYLARIDQMLTSMAVGFTGSTPQPQGQAPQEQPIKRRRRTKAEMEAARAAGEAPEVAEE